MMCLIDHSYLILYEESNNIGPISSSPFLHENQQKIHLRYHYLWIVAHCRELNHLRIAFDDSFLSYFVQEIQ